jgi:hypothetical protein
MCRRECCEHIVVSRLDFDSSDAPYSVVVPLRTTAEYEGIFWREFFGDIFFEKRVADFEIEVLNGEVTA